MLHNVRQLVLDVPLVSLADDVTQVVAHMAQKLVLGLLQTERATKQHKHGEPRPVSPSEPHYHPGGRGLNVTE